MKPFFASGQTESAENLWEQFVREMSEFLQDTEMWKDVSFLVLRIVLICVISRLALAVLNRIIDHATNEKKSRRLKLRTRRVQTLGRLLKNTASYLINFITILLVLGEFNIQIAPLLAGAGVNGLAIGFGAQSLVKDVITGFFIIFEDQFAVGDEIQTGSFKGSVELIGLRSTRIRSWTGEVHIIPNGSINQVTNFSVNPQLAVIDITVSSDYTIEEMMTLMRQVLLQINDLNLTAAPEVLGVQTLAPSQMTIRITAKCRPNTVGEVTRLVNTEVKKALEAKQASVID